MSAQTGGDVSAPGVCMRTAGVKISKSGGRNGGCMGRADGHWSCVVIQAVGTLLGAHATSVDHCIIISTMNL